MSAFRCCVFFKALSAAQVVCLCVVLCGVWVSVVNLSMIGVI